MMNSDKKKKSSARKKEEVVLGVVPDGGPKESLTQKGDILELRESIKIQPRNKK